MMAQDNHPKADSFVGLWGIAMAAESDQNHRVSEEIMSDYSGENENQRKPGRGNCPGKSRPDDRGERPPQRLSLPGQNRIPSGEGAPRAGDHGKDRGSGQSGDDDGNGNGDDGGDGCSDNDDDLYSSPRSGM